jgi:hypothetical protein
MALSEAQGSSPAKGRTAPSWIFFLYLAGLVLIYIGERVLSGLPKGAGIVSLVGLLATLAATVLRFSPRFRVGGERRNIESLLALLSVVGLVGVLVYFTTSDFGAAKLGLDQLATEKRARFDDFARVLWISLIVLSTLPMLFAETALRPMQNAERPESRRVRSAAQAGLVLALAAIYCALFVYAAYGVDLKVDYSYFKTSKPSESTRKLVQTMSGDPIRVVAFFPEVNEVRREVSTYLKDVASHAPKLKVEIRDRLLSPKLAQELRATQDGVIILSRGGVNHTMNIGSEIESARGKLKTLDRDFQEQLVKIVNSKHTLYLTAGHGELNDSGGSKGNSARAFQLARTMLQQQNFTIKDLGMAQGLASDVPEDADVVMVLGPTQNFSSEELAALKRYIDRGGHLLLALDPDAVTAIADLVAQVTAAGEAGKPGAKAGESGQASASAEGPEQSALTKLNQDLASVVGLKFSSAVLANDKQHVRATFNNSDRARLVTNSFSSHASVSTLSRNAPRAAVVLFGAGSFEKAAGNQDRVDFSVRSMPGTYQDENHNFAQDAPLEKTGVFNMAAAFSKPALNAEPTPKKDDKDKKDAKKPDVKETRVVAFADSDAFSDLVLSEVPANRFLLVDAVRWLAGESSVQGLPNTEEDVKIEHTKQADLGWFYATIFGGPGLVLGAGVLISRRSRARGGKR